MDDGVHNDQSSIPAEPQEHPSPAHAAHTGDGISDSASPREVGDRLMSVTETIQRELDALRRVSEEQEQREASLIERETKLESRERKLADAVESLRSGEHEIEQQREALSQREAEVSAQAEQIAQRHREVEERTATLSQREQEVAAKDAELTELRQKVETAQRTLEQSERDLATGLERLSAQKKVLRDREQTVGEREATCDAREAEVASLETSVSSASESIRRITELESQLRKAEAGHNETIVALRQKLEEALSDASQAQDRCAALESQANKVDSEENSQEFEAEIARRDEALERLSERLRAAISKSESLEKQLAEVGADAMDDGESSARSEFNALRRERLNRLKTLLEDRAKKVIRAREALARKAAELEEQAQQIVTVPADDSYREQLQQRLAEAEKVLAMRAALSERQAVLEKQARIVQRKAAKSPAGALMAAFTIMIAASAIGGWVLAGQFTQATYLAQSTIVMEMAGGSPTSEQVKGWTNFHQTLAQDPQLMERVAERMRRRGYEELGTAANVSARLRNDLEVQPGARGELNFTLRGEGQARTEGVLDTFVGSLVQMGNDTRDRRQDRTAAIVKTGAKADSRPIGDPRLQLAVMIGAGLAAISMCVWLISWRGLCKRSLISPDDTVDLL